MNDLNERDVLRLARRVARRRPGATRAEAAIVATRAAIGRETPLPAASRRWIVLATSGLAAALAVSVGVALIVESPQPASAAERVAQAVRADAAYRGWVQCTFHDTEADGTPFTRTRYSNTLDDSLVEDLQLPDGRRQVRAWWPTRGEFEGYDSTRQLTRKSSLSNEQRAELVGAVPLTLDSLLDGFRSDGQPPFDVVAAGREEGLDRFDLRRPADATRPAEGASEVAKMTLWIDPQTHLIQRNVLWWDGRPIREEIAYGGPGVRDLYDLGVPRTATTQAAALSSSVLMSLMERLTARSAKTFAPFVAVQTSDDGSRCFLTLLCETDRDGLLNTLYGVKAIATTIEPVGRPRITAPIGWPTPTLEATLAALRGASPWHFIALRDGRGWSGYVERELTDAEGRRDAPIHRRERLEALIWPMQVPVADNPDESIEIAPLDGHPGQIGLKTMRSIREGRGRSGFVVETHREERLYMLDLAHDDLPVTIHTEQFDGGAIVPESITTTTYAPPTQLPDGRWVPTAWTSEGTWHSADGAEHTGKEKSYLRFFAGATLDASWFRNYAEAETTQPTTRP